MFVTARPGEPFEALYRRFKRGVEDAGILTEYRRRQHFIPEHERRREQIRKAKSREKRARSTAT